MILILGEELVLLYFLIGLSTVTAVSSEKNTNDRKGKHQPENTVQGLNSNLYAAGSQICRCDQSLFLLGICNTINKYEESPALESIGTTSNTVTPSTLTTVTSVEVYPTVETRKSLDDTTVSTSTSDMPTDSMELGTSTAIIRTSFTIGKTLQPTDNLAGSATAHLDPNNVSVESIEPTPTKTVVDISATETTTALPDTEIYVTVSTVPTVTPVSMTTAEAIYVTKVISTTEPPAIKRVAANLVPTVRTALEHNYLIPEDVLEATNPSVGVLETSEVSDLIEPTRTLIIEDDATDTPTLPSSISKTIIL